MRHHLKKSEVPPASTNRVKITEPNTWLRDCQGIGWWWNKPRRHEGLKISNRCNSKIDIIPPARHNRIAINPLMTPLFKEAEVSLAHLTKREPLPEDRRAYECVWIAWRITTRQALAIQRPEVISTRGASLPDKTILLEVIKPIFIIWQHDLSKSLTAECDK